jgi:hypothetical protein
MIFFYQGIVFSKLVILLQTSLIFSLKKHKTLSGSCMTKKDKNICFEIEQCSQKFVMMTLLYRSANH